MPNFSDPALATCITNPSNALANILSGTFSATVTTALTTMINIPAGRLWQGTVSYSLSATTAGAVTTGGSVVALIQVTGVGGNPANGFGFFVTCTCGANVAAGTVGNNAAITGVVPFIVQAGPNIISLQASATITTGRADIMCQGAIL